MEDSINRMFFSSGPDALKRGNVFSHRHDLRAGLLLDERVAFHVVAVGVTAKDDFDVLKFESEFGHRVADHAVVSLVIRVDEDVPLRCRHQKRSERFRAHVVHVTDDLVRRELLVLLLRRSDVAGEEFGNSPDAWRLSSERSALEARRESIFRAAFPEARVVVDPELQMARNLADLKRERGLAAGDEFLVQMTAAARGAPVKSVEYANGRLATR